MKKVTSKDGTVIAYDQFGSGLPVILIDGALCSRDFGPMPKLAQLLAKNFTVINYDRRGRNESGDTKPYAMEREIEDIEALINKAGGPAFVVGISSGAALALAAATSGLNIAKLALYEPPFIVDDEGHHPPADSLERLKTMIAADRRADAVKFFMKDMIGLPSIGIFIMQIMPIFKKLKRAAHTLPYDITIMGDFSLPATKAASVKIPTLIAGGDKSQVTLQHAIKKLAEVMPDNTLQILKGQTHNVSPKVIAPVLTGFFNS
jgi:pimeloyl-ACP methyl ester carboxylesterase